MNSEIIRASWRELTGQRREFIDTFYTRLFERYPDYRDLFPPHMNVQLEHMIEMISTLAQFADHTHLLEPYLGKVGFAHRGTGIHADDVENFKEVFLDTLAAFSTADDVDSRCRAWREVFDDVIIPLFDEGLERGRSLTNPDLS